MNKSDLIFLIEDNEGNKFGEYLHSKITAFNSNISDSNALKLFADTMNQNEAPNFVKYRLMLEIFNELDIFHVEYIPLVSDSIGDRWQLPEDICVITRGSAEKVNLDDSKLLAKLKEQITI